MAPHSSTLALKIPWMEEPGRLQSMGWLRVRHDWATSLSLFTFMHWRGNGNPLLCSCLERDRGAWWATVYRVAQSGTWLKWLSSSSRASCLMGEVWVGLFLHPHPPLNGVMSRPARQTWFLKLRYGERKRNETQEFREKRGSGDQHRSMVKVQKLNPSQLYYNFSCEWKNMRGV